MVAATGIIGVAISDDDAMIMIGGGPMIITIHDRTSLFISSSTPFYYFFQSIKSLSLKFSQSNIYLNHPSNLYPYKLINNFNLIGADRIKFLFFLVFGTWGFWIKQYFKLNVYILFGSVKSSHLD
ncbi:hypothetical protein L1987_62615 [Smallanthus sonchifolius]|uniref:Uncharacterized protein n=1 Tax=Smallanthus sonchifolius TaxID=185202 RepID=A0ACB9CB93_9ASTR|nr:hypothetical protein L1987_62615 [Smallanthus sonchifolius]